MARTLVKAAKKIGANPDHWFGVIGALPLIDVQAIDVIDEHDKWIRVRYPEVRG
jgi:hypothetical protein